MSNLKTEISELLTKVKNKVVLEWDELEAELHKLVDKHDAPVISAAPVEAMPAPEAPVAEPSAAATITAS